MRPKLIHPVEVEICNISETTAQDIDFKVPVSDVIHSTPIKVKAQVHYYKALFVEAVASGFQQKGDGYLLMDKADAAGIQWNAMISKIDGDAVEYYVRDFVPAIHYDHSKFKVLVFESKDKGKA